MSWLWKRIVKTNNKFVLELVENLEKRKETAQTLKEQGNTKIYDLEDKIDDIKDHQKSCNKTIKFVDKILNNL